MATKFAGNGLSRTAMIYKMATLGGKVDAYPAEQGEGREPATARTGVRRSCTCWRQG